MRRRGHTLQECDRLILGRLKNRIVIGTYAGANPQLGKKEPLMPLFEVETDAHIIITWGADEQTARSVAKEAFPSDTLVRITKRPRDTWVISKAALGLTDQSVDPCGIARNCLNKASGDKVHAIRLYVQETGADIDQARKIIESNMVMGW